MEKNQKEDIRMSNAYNIGQIMGLVSSVKINLNNAEEFLWKDESIKYLDEIYKLADELEL
tara:strand:+ start:294 stop:473 length:180 start_codon:yes stop_codon:yes gene_type:complete